MYVSLQLENDLSIVAERGREKWKTSIEIITLRNSKFTIECTDAELGAIVGLAIGGDEMPGNTILYEVAEEVLARFNVPDELRPIP